MTGLARCKGGCGRVVVRGHVSMFDGDHHRKSDYCEEHWRAD
jgi:hypothetical protein